LIVTSNCNQTGPSSDNANRDCQVLNDTKAHDFSIDGRGNDRRRMVYANAGYSGIPVMPGNMFLAFWEGGK
jgi:hypothetical protein